MIFSEKQIPVRNSLEEFENVFSKSNILSVSFVHYKYINQEESGYYENERLDRRSIRTFEEMKIRFLNSEKYETLNPTICLITKYDLNPGGIHNIIKASPDTHEYKELKGCLSEILYNLHNKTLLLERT